MSAPGLHQHPSSADDRAATIGKMGSAGLRAPVELRERGERAQ